MLLKELAPTSAHKLFQGNIRAKENIFPISAKVLLICMRSTSEKSECYIIKDLL